MSLISASVRNLAFLLALPCLNMYVRHRPFLTPVLEPASLTSLSAAIQPMGSFMWLVDVVSHRGALGSPR